MAELPADLTAALADRYRLERELGRGGMATVYLAEDLKHHRPSPIAPKVRSRLLMLLACAVLACQGDPLAPAPPPPPPPAPAQWKVGSLSVAVTFGSASRAGLEVRTMHVQLRRPAADVAKDTDVAVPANADSMVVLVLVPVRSVDTSDVAREEFELRLALTGRPTDTLFRAGPETVTVVAGDVAMHVALSPVYVGIGYDAHDVIVTPSDTVLSVGDTITLVATALNAGSQPIPGTPVIWTSLDLAIVTAVDRTGHVTSASQMGDGRVEARLLTGQADTSVIAVKG